MTLNLDDVERYLVEQAGNQTYGKTGFHIKDWLHGKFHELRERERLKKERKA